jgi:DNA (cytosine-5)-methyltransferase 1
MTFGSLFAGIGGFDLGLERAGMKCLWQVEIDPFCQKVLAKHWPDVRRYGDVRECGRHNLETVDLIAGGFPCQPVSVAGKQGGQNDERWLWPEFTRVIGDLRPKWVLVENVPGLLSANDGREMGEVLRNLAQCGYDAEWECLPAYLFGPPQSRTRVFLVAYPKQQSQGQGPLLRWRSWHQVQTGPYGWEKDEESNGHAIEPNVGRVADGVPNRVDRLRALGNAVVPQVAEWIGRRIIEADGHGKN